MREKEKTLFNGNDNEIKETLKNDEYNNYFNKENTKEILITTLVSRTFGIFKFIKELKNVIPNSYFYYR